MNEPSWVKRYGLALLLTAAALIIWILLGSLFFRGPTPIFMAATLAAAWYGGRGPGVVSSVLGAGSAALYLNPPKYSVDLSTRDWLSVIALLVLCLLVSQVVHVVHRSRAAEARSRLEIEERKRIQAELLRQLLHDPLTGLPNRVLLMDRIEQAMLSARREGSHVAILFIDLNDFKLANDTFGHREGDEVLRGVGPRLRRVLRERDTVARIGGDEFVILLPGVDAVGAETVARKVMEALDQSVSANEHAVHLTASVGVSVYPHNGSDPTVLLDLADSAMYIAKREHLGYVLAAGNGRRPQIQPERQLS